jgi:hypothetical protein
LSKENIMGRFAWQDRVDSLSAMLDPLEIKGEQGTAGLEELKSALDDLRLRAWAMLMATNADDPHAFQERFRTRRGIEMCRALVADLGTGKLSNRPSDLPDLGSAARDLGAAVKKAAQKSPKKRSKKAG